MKASPPMARLAKATIVIRCNVSEAASEAYAATLICKLNSSVISLLSEQSRRKAVRPFSEPPPARYPLAHQNRLKRRDSLIGRPKKQLRLLRQLRLAGREWGGHVGPPLFINPLTRLPHVFLGLACRNSSRLSLVGRIDKRNHIIVGDRFWLPPRHNPVHVNRPQRRVAAQRLPQPQGCEAKGKKQRSAPWDVKLTLYTPKNSDRGGHFGFI